VPLPLPQQRHILALLDIVRLSEIVSLSGVREFAPWVATEVVRDFCNAHMGDMATPVTNEKSG
jgi:hypothetical protein